MNLKERKPINTKHQINDEIRDKEIRLIDENGEQLGVVQTAKAMELALEKNVDLVKISPQANPPVCKLMDYGKYKFDTIKREKEAKRNQKVTELKEIWLSMTIDTHDLEFKAKSCAKFLAELSKVKVSIRMKGRQMAHPELGYQVMERFIAIISAEIFTVEKRPFREGRNINMILAPIKKN